MFSFPFLFSLFPIATQNMYLKAFVALLAIAQHDEKCRLLQPNHLPKILSNVIVRTLSSNVRSVGSITNNKELTNS